MDSYLMITSMDDTENRFQTEIYQEHLAQIGFLLDQRAHYFTDNHITWVEAKEIEERLLAHLQGIYIGNMLARDCAIELLNSGDEDELLGAAYCLATIDLGDAGLGIVINAFQQADDAHLIHYVEAFKHGRHSKLSASLNLLLTHERAPIRATITQVLGYRRAGDPKRLWPLLHDPDETVRTAAVVAVSRFGQKEALAALEQTVFDSFPSLRDDLLVSLLYLGSVRAYDVVDVACLSPGIANPVLLLARALAAKPDTFNALRIAGDFPGMQIPVCYALGVYGSTDAINYLISSLNSDDDAQKEMAAQSLELITAAGLRETVSVAEPEDEDLSVAEVLDQQPPQASTKLPDRESTPPPLREVERVCTDLARWTDWWKNNQSRFTFPSRYRRGKPFDLSLCIDEMADPYSNLQTRQRAYLELLIHSSHHIPFEPDWFIPNQIAAIAQWRAAGIAQKQ